MDDDIFLGIIIYLIGIVIGLLIMGVVMSSSNNDIFGNICESLNNDTGYYYYGKYHSDHWEGSYLECGKILIVNETERKGVVWQDD